MQLHPMIEAFVYECITTGIVKNTLYIFFTMKECLYLFTHFKEFSKSLQ